MKKATATAIAIITRQHIYEATPRYYRFIAYHYAYWLLSSSPLIMSRYYYRFTSVSYHIQHWSTPSVFCHYNGGHAAWLSCYHDIATASCFTPTPPPYVIYTYARHCCLYCRLLISPRHFRLPTLLHTVTYHAAYHGYLLIYYHHATPSRHLSRDVIRLRHFPIAITHTSISLPFHLLAAHATLAMPLHHIINMNINITAEGLLFQQHHHWLTVIEYVAVVL